MRHEGVDVSITDNSTNPTRFQHPVAGTYKKWTTENGMGNNPMVGASVAVAVAVEEAAK